jgi:hypothetical protein
MEKVVQQRYLSNDDEHPAKILAIQDKGPYLEKVIAP